MPSHLNKNSSSPSNKKSSSCNPCTRNHLPLFLVSFLIFAVLSGAAIALYKEFSDSRLDEIRSDVRQLTAETGSWFAKELDMAILPLFSMAQFGVELSIFADLPSRIGPMDDYLMTGVPPGSVPFLSTVLANGTTVVDPARHRNLTGICDQRDLIDRFNEIAAVKRNAKMDGILHNIQLSPYGVVCLLYPLNNTEDFTDGKFLDSTKARGTDLLNSPINSYIARASIKQDKVGIAGPRPLTQCPDCGLYFIARLPVPNNPYHVNATKMLVDGEFYDKWGFATALINWDNLVRGAPFREHFASKGYEFQLTRTDRELNAATGAFDTAKVVVLAESEHFHSLTHEYSTALQTTDNEWVMTVRFRDDGVVRHTPLVIAISVLVAMCIAYLVFTVLLQKQRHTTMMGMTLAQEAKVDIERNMTAYFAHELRNPLAVIDSALASMPETDMPDDARHLLESMQLCSSFMSSIMNNLLDVRKMEEGLLVLKSNPLSLSGLVNNTICMALPSVRPNVALRAVSRTSAENDWVSGDIERIQQILINIVSNAIKYTMVGSITLTVDWTASNLVRFQCEDTGPGIPRSEQADLFNRFTTRGGAPGTGLGLSIAKQIVTLIGGSIQFESDPTVQPGTNCQVLLPLKLVREPESAVPDSNGLQ
jgi:signal transduction histidine kinase